MSSTRSYIPNHIIDTTTGFTDRDEVLVSLYDICKCYLTLEHANDMILFNDNCYDRTRCNDLQDFYLMKYNTAMSNGRYSYKVIRDPRTNTHINYDDAMTRLFFDSIYIPCPFHIYLRMYFPVVCISLIIGIMPQISSVCD